MAKNPKILVIGVSSYDTIIYIDTFPKIKDDMAIFPNKVHYTVGGTGAGKAMALSTLGANTVLATDLGNDLYKENVMNFLSEYKVEIIPLDADKTTTHTNIMHDLDKRISIFTQVGNKVSFNPGLEHYIKDADLVYLNINHYALDYLPLIRRYKKPIFVDIHDYDEINPYHEAFIKVADYLMVSGVNIKDSKAFFSEHYKNHELIIITHGAKGSEVIDHRGNHYTQKAYPVKTFIDSNGAGDAYSSAFMIEYLVSKDIKESMKLASVTAKLACESEHLYPKEATLDLVKSKI
jgi:sugar/nucleoside kinase (ribokinase family)